MPVFSLIQLKSDSIGRENPTYSLGKQLICRWEGLLALLFVDRRQQIEVLLLGEPLFERPVAVGPVSTETAPSIVGNTRRWIAHNPVSGGVFASWRKSGPFGDREPVGSALDDKVELHPVKESVFRGAVPDRSKPIGGHLRLGGPLPFCHTGRHRIGDASHLARGLSAAKLPRGSRQPTGQKRRSAGPGGDCSSDKKANPGATPNNSPPRSGEFR